jgi:presequence protease
MENYKNFILTKDINLPEINSKLVELTHKTTNAQVMHIQNDDDENFFSLCFKTYPSDSTGVAHILEHIVLCGSKNFPVKDPFFSMTRRSLNTFMNAMTGSDFTCYPASSQVEKDFYNLFSVYLDAVFNPLIKKESFLQEAHRLEFEKDKLMYKGVVYNEMKGAMSSPDSRMWDYIMKHLYPGLTYSNNSGGDPSDIPNLTYDQLIDFHKKHYNPSNCIFFFYGNIDLSKHLAFIEEKILNNYTTKIPSLKIPLQKRFSSPKIITENYPIAKNEDESDKTIYAFSFLTAPITNEKETLALTLLDSVLMETDASPLKYALLQSNLCKEAISFIDTDLSEMPWIIVCKGCQGGIKNELLKVISKTLVDLSKNKISKKLIEASLHQLEFARSEIRAEGVPYGLTLFMRSALAKQHGANAENSLLIHTLFNELKQKLENDNFLPSLIEKYILANPHALYLDMVPDKTLLAKEDTEEKINLEKIQQKLTKKEIEEIKKQKVDLEKYHDFMEKQSIDCLPKIKIDDIPKKIKYYPLTKHQENGLNVYHHDVFTNNILYVNLTFEIPSLSDEELKILPLFSQLLTELGCSDRDYKTNLEYINTYTGGVGGSLILNPQIQNTNICNPIFSLSGKALYKNSEKLFSIINDFANSYNFSETNRIVELLSQIYTILSHRINSDAMKYAVEMSWSNINTPQYLSNLFNGLPFFNHLTSVVKNLQTNLPNLMHSFENIAKKIFSSKNRDLIIGCDKKQFDLLKEKSFFNIDKIEKQDFEKWDNEKIQKEKIEDQGRIISTPVSFNSFAMQVVNFTDETSPSLFVVTHLLENKILHPQIREKGGAYGSGARYSSTSGCFHFFSYRDPNISKTFSTFLLAIEKIAKGEFDENDLEEAKLGALQSVESPISPGARAITTYLFEKSGKTQELRQKYKDDILSLTKEDIIDAINKNLVSKDTNETFISFSSKEILEKENQKLEKPIKILTI